MINKIEQIESILHKLEIPLFEKEKLAVVRAVQIQNDRLVWNLLDLIKMNLDTIYFIVIEIQKKLSYNGIESRLNWLTNSLVLVSLELNYMEKHLNFVIPYESRNNYINFVFEVNQLVGNKGLCVLNIDNNPYHLESMLYVETKKENEIRAVAVKHNVKELGNGKTNDEYLIEALKYRKWNSISLSPVASLEEIEMIFSACYQFRSKEELGSLGYEDTTNLCKVFISYSHKDKDIVDQIEQELIDSGVSVWFDDLEIDFGDHILSKVTEGINSSPISLVFISENTKESLFARQELSAIYLNAINQKKSRMILVKIDNVEVDEVFFGLNSFKNVDIKNQAEKLKLFQFLREEIKRLNNEYYK